MHFTRGALYWLNSSHIVVEYIAPTSGDQHQVKKKETGEVMTVSTSDILQLDREAYETMMEEFSKQGLNMKDIWKTSAEYKGVVASKTWEPIFGDFELSTEEAYGQFVEDTFGFDLFPNRPQTAAVVESDSTMFWIIGAVGIVFLMNYK